MTESPERFTKPFPLGMARTKGPALATQALATAEKRAGHRQDSGRDTLESIIIALVLALLFKTFEAEAFIIPTGSMAPTLRGMHKDILDELTGARYAAGVPGEILKLEENAKKFGITPFTQGPYYGFPTPLERADGGKNRTFYTYAGDRLLVSKVAFWFQDPRRWDVVVFRCPEKASVNYIKRMVGQPGETIKIQLGDIYSAKPGQPYEIARKPPAKMREMLQPVFNTDYTVAGLDEAYWPAPWITSKEDAGAWKRLNDGKAFRTTGGSDRPVWLHYQHVMPSWADWETYNRSPASDRAYRRIQPKLITDFGPYNSYSHDGQPRPEAEGMNWVGDLQIEGDFEVSAVTANASLQLELIRGGIRHQCRIPLATGLAELWRDDEKLATAQAPTAVTGPGTYHLAFSNVDCELRLQVNGTEIAFDARTTYAPRLPVQPNELDLQPVGIGSQGVTCEVQHLKIGRDIFYTLLSKHGGSLDITLGEDEQSDPRFWGDFQNPPSLTYNLADDEFMMCGDNSRNSSDSRAWKLPGVNRNLLVGKALIIYWPHGWETTQHTTLPSGVSPLPLHVPFYPDFERMKFIR